MPKKSKRQKLLSDARRTASESVYSFEVKRSREPRIQQDHSGSSEVLSIKRDIAKTVLLAAVAFAVEFSLYFGGFGKQ